MQKEEEEEERRVTVRKGCDQTQTGKRKGKRRQLDRKRGDIVTEWIRAMDAAWKMGQLLVNKKAWFISGQQDSKRKGQKISIIYHWKKTTHCSLGYKCCSLPFGVGVWSLGVQPSGISLDNPVDCWCVCVW